MESEKLSLVDYIAIGGTIIVLGSAFLSFIALTVIRIYLLVKFGLLEYGRYVTYARHEAPQGFHVARSWINRLLVVGFALVFAYIASMAFVLGFLKEA